MPTQLSSAAPFVALQGGTGTVPAWGKPNLVLSSPSGIGLFTPAHHVAIAGKTLTIVAGQDINTSSTRNTAVCVRGGICLFTYGKAQNGKKPNTETGIAAHAATGSVHVSALKDKAALTADQTITIDSVTAEVTLSAPASTLLATGGGSYLKITNGSIELGTSGAARFEAAMKNLTSASSESGNAQLPSSSFKACELRMNKSKAAGGGFVVR